jgi:hypothetical protein
MFNDHNVLQCNHNIISTIVLIFNQYLIVNTLLKCCKSTKPCKGQVCDMMVVTTVSLTIDSIVNSQFSKLILMERMCSSSLLSLVPFSSAYHITKSHNAGKLMDLVSSGLKMMVHSEKKRCK